MSTIWGSSISTCDNKTGILEREYMQSDCQGEFHFAFALAVQKCTYQSGAALARFCGASYQSNLDSTAVPASTPYAT